MPECANQTELDDGERKQRCANRSSTFQQCSGELMNTSKSLIAAAVVALLPLAAIAGDTDKKPAAMSTATSAQFDTLDTNRDGRISRTEAASDSKIVFSSADKNSDGYLDSSEYMHREMSNDATTSPGNPAKSTETPRE
jgi:hypothetical protein